MARPTLTEVQWRLKQEARLRKSARFYCEERADGANAAWLDAFARDLRAGVYQRVSGFSYRRGKPGRYPVGAGGGSYAQAAESIPLLQTTNGLMAVFWSVVNTDSSDLI